MSSKNKALLKKLRKEKKEEDPKIAKARKEAEEAAAAPKSVADERKAFLMRINRKEAKKKTNYIDPLEYFNKEHLVVRPENMAKYKIKEADILKEIAKEEEELKKMGEKTMAYYKINIDEFIKVRGRILHKSDPEVFMKKNKRSNSISKKRGDGEIKLTAEDIKMIQEENLYFKLTLARSKYNQSSVNKKPPYENIKKLISEFQDLKDLPLVYRKEIYDLEKKLKPPERLILIPDIQVFNPKEDYVKLTDKPVNLDELIN